MNNEEEILCTEGICKIWIHRRFCTEVTQGNTNTRMRHFCNKSQWVGRSMQLLTHAQRYRDGETWSWGSQKSCVGLNPSCITESAVWCAACFLNLYMSGFIVDKVRQAHKIWGVPISVNKFLQVKALCQCLPQSQYTASYSIIFLNYFST